MWLGKSQRDRCELVPFRGKRAPGRGSTLKIPVFKVRVRRLVRLEQQLRWRENRRWGQRGMKRPLVTDPLVTRDRIFTWHELERHWDWSILTRSPCLNVLKSNWGREILTAYCLSAHHTPGAMLVIDYKGLNSWSRRETELTLCSSMSFNSRQSLSYPQVLNLRLKSSLLWAKGSNSFILSNQVLW